MSGRTLSRRNLVGAVGAMAVSPRLPDVCPEIVTLPKIAISDLGIPYSYQILSIHMDSDMNMVSMYDFDRSLTMGSVRTHDGWTLNTSMPVPSLNVPMSTPRAFAGLFRGFDKFLASQEVNLGSMQAEAIERSLIARGGSWLSRWSATALGHERDRGRELEFAVSSRSDGPAAVRTALLSPSVTAGDTLVATAT